MWFEAVFTVRKPDARYVKCSLLVLNMVVNIGTTHI
jgi:hypothetical protein